MSRLRKSRRPFDELSRATGKAQRPEQTDAGSSIFLKIILYPLQLLGRSALAAVNPGKIREFPHTGAISEGVGTRQP